MDTNIAIAYTNVVVIDPKSTMKAGKITLDMETKEIFINPELNKKSKVKINMFIRKLIEVLSVILLD